MEAFPCKIRLIQTADLPAFKELRLLSIKDSSSAFAKSADEFQLISDQNLIPLVCPGENQFTFGAFLDSGELVGITGLFRGKHSLTAHKGTIWGVFVKPEFRRKGISKALLKQVLDYLPQFGGINLVNLTVSQSQPAARALYLSFGFKIYGTEERALRVGEDYFSEELMKLDLIKCA